MVMKYKKTQRGKCTIKVDIIYFLCYNNSIILKVSFMINLEEYKNRLIDYYFYECDNSIEKIEKKS